jgi:hypothetical protein
MDREVGVIEFSACEHVETNDFPTKIILPIGAKKGVRLCPVCYDAIIGIVLMDVLERAIKTAVYEVWKK